MVWNYDKFYSELERQVDTNKVKVFFRREAPRNVILSNRKFSYPPLKVSTRAFEVVDNVPSHLQKYKLN